MKVRLGKTGQLEIFLLLLILFAFYPDPTYQYTITEPVNVGFIVALPWDVSNTLRAPLAGPVSIALTVVMAAILLFGLLLAPVNYILGYPPRIYHPSRKAGLIQTMVYGKAKEKLTGIKGRSMDEEDYFAISSTSEVIGQAYDMMSSNKTFEIREEKLDTTSSSTFPDFVTSAFYFIPERDDECRKLILCHAHGFLRMFPTRLKKFVRFFSKRSVSITDEYKEAVLLGFESQTECRRIYKCSKDLTLILKEVLYSLISTDLKALLKLKKLF